MLALGYKSSGSRRHRHRVRQSGRGFGRRDGTSRTAQRGPGINTNNSTKGSFLTRHGPYLDPNVGSVRPEPNLFAAATTDKHRFSRELKRSSAIGNEWRTHRSQRARVRVSSIDSVNDSRMERQLPPRREANTIHLIKRIHETKQGKCSESKLTDPHAYRVKSQHTYFSANMLRRGQLDPKDD